MKPHPTHIIQEPHPTLRAHAAPVTVTDIRNKPVQNALHIMHNEMYASGDGVAIAAPQINVPLRMFMVAGFVFDQINKYTGAHGSPDRVFINPEIIKQAKTKKKFPGEGCLSVRYVYGVTKRSTGITVRAHDENGDIFTIAATGFLAQILQHEIDHLNGILFIDHAHEVRKMPPDEIVTYEHELDDIRRKRGIKK